MTRLSARETLDRSMSEEELLIAITDALTVFQYTWTHSRRSDKALTMGHRGVPDIIAARKGIVWFIELKSERGRLDADQFAWMHALGWPQNAMDDCQGVQIRVWFPSDVDAALAELA